MLPPATLLVPAAAYDEALDFCNARRAEAGLPLWDELPPGMPCDTRSCPCGRAVPGLRVWGGGWFIGDGVTHTRGGPKAFIAHFDHHAEQCVRTLPVRGED